MTEKPKGLCVNIAVDHMNCVAGELVDAGKVAMLDRIEALQGDPQHHAAVHRAKLIRRIAEGYDVDLHQTDAAETLLRAMEADRNSQARAIAAKVRLILGNHLAELMIDDKKLEPIRKEKERQARRSIPAPPNPQVSGPNTASMWSSEYEHASAPRVHPPLKKRAQPLISQPVPVPPVSPPAPEPPSPELPADPKAAELARAKALVEATERPGPVKAAPLQPRERTPEEVANAIRELKKRGYRF